MFTKLRSSKVVTIWAVLVLSGAFAAAAKPAPMPVEESELPTDLAKLLIDAEATARRDIKAGNPILLHAVTIRTTGETASIEPSVRSGDIETELRDLMDTLRSQVRDGTIRASVIVAPWEAKPGQGISSVLFDLELRRGPRFMARLPYDGLGADAVFGERQIFRDQPTLFAP